MAETALKEKRRLGDSWRDSKSANVARYGGVGTLEFNLSLTEFFNVNVGHVISQVRPRGEESWLNKRWIMDIWDPKVMAMAESRRVVRCVK